MSTKSYRCRKLHRRVQLALAGPDNKPIRDEHGQAQLAYDGQWFYVVAVGADRMRLLPVDHSAFFNSKAAEATRLLQAKGKTGVVTPERLYAHYSAKFTKPSETYAPPGQPEEFTLVLSKHLAVNMTHGYSSAGRSGSTDVMVDDLSVLAGLLTNEEITPTTPDPLNVAAPEETSTKKRKGKNAPTADPGPVQLSDLIP